MDKIQILQKLLDNTKVDELKWNVMFEISKKYLELGMEKEGKEWVKKGFELDKNRSENLYLLCKYYREKGEIKKAYAYYLIGKQISKPLKGLNIDSKVYDYLFDYEATILWYYIYHHNLVEGLKKSLSFLRLDTPYFENVYHNLEFYIQPLKDKSKNDFTFNFTPEKGYYNSSPSLIRFGDKFLMNIRYHNYYITDEGSYLSNEIKDGQYIVRTKNSFVYLDDEYRVIEEEKKMPDFLDNLKTNNTRIKGLEDMRIFQYKNEVYYIGTSCEYSPQFRIILGKYDTSNQMFLESKILLPPTETPCEKNWIPLVWKDKINFIYNWYPLTIGTVEGDKLQIFHSQHTPRYFSKIRGSSNAFEYQYEYWCLTHSVKHTSPRKYWHQFVILDKYTLKIKRYSLPFTFKSMTVEYCLSIYIKDEIITFIFSEFDKTSSLLQIEKSKIEFIEI